MSDRADEIMKDRIEAEEVLNQLDQAIEENEHLRTKNERYKEALEFYAQLDRNASVAEEALRQTQRRKRK